MQKLALVILGSGLGGGARYLFSGWVATTSRIGFPLGTLAINAIGSFLIVVIMEIGMSTQLIAPNLRLALTTGLLGGFTTYSTFTYETVDLARGGAWSLAALNLILTVALCLAAGGLGLASARWMLSR